MKESAATRLFVFVPPHRLLPGGKLAASTVVSYVALGASPQSGETPIALLPKAAAIDLVFDSADVFVSAIDAPKLSEAKLRLALPNLLEDRLLSDSSDLHYAYLLPARASGATTLAAQPKLAVAAVDRGLLTRTLDACGECGLRPRAAYSEIYTVPAPDAGVLSVRVDRGRGVARSARHEGFAFDFDGTAVPAALALAIRQLGVKRIWAFGREAGKLVPFGGELGVQIEDARRDLEPSATEAAVNLLQGPFAPAGLLGGLSLLGLPKLTRAQLRAPLAWLAVAGVTFVVGMNAYYLKLDHEARALRSQMETAFRSVFPEVAAVVDPVLQTQRQLSALRARAGMASADDFSVLNAQAAQLLSSAPLGIVAGLQYRDGALKITFKPGTADNPGLQNALRAQAVQQGLNLRFEGDATARLAPAGG
ncbi:MAG: type II secretion system protein GspL [Sutterellaceae bacterium]|nr:type II secretion system protein GspL [Burkholderiaceae bacterium]MCX7901369.1 type II secretion system protein GspL [Burkholderiaceae bacterium]MDW8429946.1 type II secretion system protein GspL [Sutterellaceae bacterium]